MPKLVSRLIPSAEPRPEPFGDPLLDAYLEFLSGRCRPNTVLAARFDLKVFFTVVANPVKAATATDVLGFVTAQRSSAAHVRDPLLTSVEVDTVGVSLRIVRCRLSTNRWPVRVLTARGEVPTNPVPRGLPTRRARHRPTQGLPLVTAPRPTLPRILTPAEVDALTAALRTHRDRAMVAAMLLGGLRRCEVLGQRLEDVRAAERRLFIAEGKGGHQRFVPISSRFFEHLAAYLEQERPADADTDAVFLVLKRPRRGQPLSAYGLDEVLDGARARARLVHASCHQCATPA
ncbi:tyrosine-type recombinase/integrase [Terrabacter carboxydivorans]|uniref:Tyr recombinase domain-containing protein n=1 Tax=Terrabacter carboxydivorans TaxID=619730 RepID=A0ABP5ZNL7_9MICO